MRKLVSKIDNSVNFLIKYGKGKIECRYVKRKDNKFNTYLSSHSGCTMGCQFCFLTKMGETSFKHCNMDQYLIQLDTILKYRKKKSKNNNEKIVNINFMARGEPLANKIVINKYDQLYNKFLKRAKIDNLKIKMNISTILPYTIKNKELYDIFGKNVTYIYYSLYSIEDKFSP